VKNAEGYVLVYHDGGEEEETVISRSPSTDRITIFPDTGFLVEFADFMKSIEPETKPRVARVRLVEIVEEAK